MSKVSLSVNSNVNIKVLDEHGHVVRESCVHNKATKSLVDGILGFLQGQFNRTNFNNNEEYVTNNLANAYIPVKIRFGNVGVALSDRTSDTPRLRNIEYGKMKEPTFDDYDLQDRIAFEQVGGDTSLLLITTTKTTTYDDPNNSEGLLLQAFIPSGALVGIGSGEERRYFIDNVIGDGLGWDYYYHDENDPVNSGYHAMFTEIGLYSSTNLLLARVLFDEKVTVDPNTGQITFDDPNSDRNPIIQTDNTSIVIEWRIGITSVGPNDIIVTQGYIPPPIEPDDIGSEEDVIELLQEIGNGGNS